MSHPSVLGGKTVIDHGVLTIGGLPKAALLGRLHAIGALLNDAARALFDDRRFTVLAEERTIEILSPSVAELGFDDGATYGQVIASAALSGWTECPLELGAHLRLQYLEPSEFPIDTNATKGTAPPGSLTIASTPLDDNDETPKGFYLRRFDGERWLRGYRSWAGHVWKPEDRFVFRRAERAPM